MQDCSGATVHAAAISGNPSFLLLPSDPGLCFCVIPGSHVAQQKCLLGCRQKCQQGLELPGTFCLSRFLLSSLMDWACLEGGVRGIVSVGRRFVCYHGSTCIAAAAAAGSGSGEAAECGQQAAWSLDLPSRGIVGGWRGLICLAAMGDDSKI